MGLGGFGSSTSGNLVGVDGSAPPPPPFPPPFPPEIIVPQGYVSGSPLKDTMTFDNATFSSLTVTPGVYVWKWGSGVNADSFTLDAGVPEPARSA